MAAAGPDGALDPEEPEREPLDERAVFSSLLEDNVEDLYENAPCGYLSTLLDGQIAKVNTTLLDWLGYRRQDLVGRRRFSDLLTVGGKLYHETHFGPLLQMQGQVNGIALELKAADGTRLPVLVTSQVKTGSDGQPLLIRTTVVDARERRAYETELLRARKDAEQRTQEAEQARREAEQARVLVEVERERLQRLAATLQRSLLPPLLSAPPGMQVAAHYSIASADEVGGDFYDVFPLTEGRWSLFLGDVCGKGAPAAAVTSLARYTLRAAAAYDPDPASVVSHLNTVLQHEYHGFDPRFCTVVFGLLTPDPSGGYALTLASGGHPPALLLRADGTADWVETPGGQLIGVLPDPHITTTTVPLGPGDTLLLYTDGLTEAHSAIAAADPAAEGDRYGDQALHDFATALAPTTPKAAITALTGLLESFGSGLDDDTALLALGVPATSTEETP
ncbi:PP2C family protein-serine/threonine phosphatase [Streptacidiphilus sp. PAMC 29251]